MTEEQQAAFLIAQYAAAMIEALGMVAANQSDAAAGRNATYHGHDFENLIARYGLGHNDALSTLGIGRLRGETDWTEIPLYTAHALQAYGDARAREALERAAKECEAADMVGTVRQWRYDHPSEAATAIRAIKENSRAD